MRAPFPEQRLVIERKYSVAFRSFAKEGGHPKRYKEMVGLCEFRGFVAIITTISNNTRLTSHDVCCQSVKELFSNRKREEEATTVAHRGHAT